MIIEPHSITVCLAVRVAPSKKDQKNIILSNFSTYNWRLNLLNVYGFEHAVFNNVHGW